MSPKIALTIGAVAAAIFGLLLTFAPGPMLEGFGLGTSDEGMVLSRDLGVTLLGIALLNWLARGAAGPAVKAILIGNFAIQVLEIVVNSYEIFADVLPAKAAGGILIHVILGAIFALGLVKARAAVAT